MKGKRSLKKMLLMALLSLSCILTVSCGAHGNENSSDTGNGCNMAKENGNIPGDGTPALDSRQGQKSIYVPSFRDITGSENGSCRNLEFNCGFLYYSVMEPGADGQNRRRFYRQNLASDMNYAPAQELYGDAEAREELAANTYAFFTDAKGYGYFILHKSETDTDQEPYFLCKYGVSGSELFRRDITAEMTAQSGSDGLNLFRRAVTDSESRIYIGQTESIYLYDKEGNLQAKVTMPGELAGMDCGRDGTVYVTYRTAREFMLGTVDFGKGTVEEIYNGFPGDGTLSGGTAYDILTMDSQKVYGFSPGMEAPEVVLSWMDSDLYGDEIVYIHGMDEGMLLAVSDGSGNESRMVFLSPFGPKDMTAKEVITIGIMSDQSSQALDTLVTRFNRSNEHYRAELIIYGQGSRDLSELTAAMDRANMEIMNGDCPDLICLYRRIIVDAYVNKGILEDLTGYLEHNSVLHREDLLAPALEQFTYGNGLYGLPRSVTLRTLVGRTDQVGEERGWNIKEMEQFISGHPDARLFNTCTKTEMLRILLEYNEQSRKLDKARITALFSFLLFSYPPYRE